MKPTQKAEVREDGKPTWWPDTSQDIVRQRDKPLWESYGQGRSTMRANPAARSRVYEDDKWLIETNGEKSW